MACRTPPRNKKLTGGSLLSIRKTILLLCVLGLSFITFFPFSDSIPLTISTPPEMQEIPEFLNFYGEPYFTNLVASSLSPNGLVYASTTSGLYILDVLQGKHNLIPQIGLPDNAITTLDVDPINERIILGGEGIAIYNLKDGSNYVFELKDGLLSNTIIDLLYLPEINAVVFIHGSENLGIGVLRLDEQTIHYYTNYNAKSEMNFQKMVKISTSEILVINDQFKGNKIYSFDAKERVLNPFLSFNHKPENTSYSTGIQIENQLFLFGNNYYYDDGELNQLELWNMQTKRIEPIPINNRYPEVFHRLSSEQILIGFSKSPVYTSTAITAPNYQNGGIGIFHVANKTLSTLLTPHFADKDINGIVTINSSHLLIGTSRGLYFFDVFKEQVKLYPLGSGIAANSVKTLTFSEQSELLYIGSDNVLYTYDPTLEKLTNFEINLDPYISPYISALSDGLGYLFIGSWGSGLYIYNEINGKIVHKNYWDGLKGNYISSVSYDASIDQLYIAHEMGVDSYSILEDKFNSLIFDQTQKEIGFISSFALNTKTNQLYISSSSGIAQWNPETGNLTYLPIPEKQITSIAIDPETDLLYYGTSDGLHSYDLEKEQTNEYWSSKDGLGSNKIESLASDGYRLYIGTETGFSIKMIKEDEIFAVT
ncbi:MAG: hypothetical protein ACXAC7_00205 [Candidatus Hodarchaeales archaeon]